MDRPVHVVLLCLATHVAVLAAESTETDPVAKRERTVSPRVADLLAAVAPKYEPPAQKGADAPSESAVPRERVTSAEVSTPANTIVRLPPYLVRERKPPSLPEREEVIGRERLEKIAMQRYLGDETGLERALSTLTPVHLWRLIPILGKYPLVTFQTNEQRAMESYEKRKQAEKMENLMSLLSPELQPDKPKSAPEK